MMIVIMIITITIIMAVSIYIVLTLVSVARKSEDVWELATYIPLKVSLETYIGWEFGLKNQWCSTLAVC